MSTLMKMKPSAAAAEVNQESANFSEKFLDENVGRRLAQKLCSLLKNLP